MMETEIKKAAAVVASGGTILYPTDTIWGIGCDACKFESVRKIYQIKQRTDTKSMLVLVNGISMLKDHLEHLPDRALELIEKQGKPTTIIYPGARNLAPNLIARDGSIGIRITSDPFCKGLIDTLGRPLVSTSANISGKDAPGAFQEIEPSIQEKVDYVVDWRRDETRASPPSTIIKLENDGSVIILRP